MPERRQPPPTDEGWYALHDFRTVDWDAWREAPDRIRERATEEAVAFFEDAVSLDDAEEGATAIYSILGSEADLLILHLRPTTADLDALKRRFETTEFAGFTDRADSYVSVTEASGYSERARDYFEGDLDPESGLARYIRSRLYPQVPDAGHVCFYPMDKRRDPEQNWYDLDFEERAEHMDAHGDIGRDYGGKVTQMITGSIGLDDWEWGVTLWADDLTDVKDLLYEMRFDPSTSQFAEFGSFYVGRRFPPADLPAFLAGEAVPAGSETAATASEDGQRAGDRSEGAAAGATSPPAERADGHEAGADADARGGVHPGSAAHGDHPHAEAEDGDSSDEASPHDDHPDPDDGAHGGDAPGGKAHGSTAHGQTTRGGHGHDGTDDDGASGGAGGRGRPDVSAAIEEVGDVESRLATLGMPPGEEYEAGDYAVLAYSDADATDLSEATEDLASDFDHYDRHVTTVVRAQQGRAAAVSVWTAKEAAETAAGFMGDLPGVSEIVGGTVSGDAGEATVGGEGTSAASTDDGTDEIREVLAEQDIYAGKPHGEDVYALVLYSRADHDELIGAVEELRENFERYEAHERTTIYQNPETETAAVVSLWESDEAAERASDYLGDLPGIVGGPADLDGFGTMGMFYTVKPEHREDFVEKFEEVGTVLADVDGHRETALLVNHEDENDMFIASRWDAREDAVDFFRSEAFSQTVDWGRDVLADRPRHVFLA